VLSYTYRQPGSYLATLNITDSVGQSTTAQTRVNVTSGAVAAAPEGTSAVLAGVAVAAIAGTLAGVGVVGLWLGRRKSSRVRDDGGESVASPAIGFTVGPTAPERIELARFPRWTDGVALPDPAGSEPASVDRVDPVESQTPVGTPSPPTAETLRLSQRIVLHLAGLGALGPDEVAPVGFTQLGMARSLGARQNGLTNVLRRLVAADVLTEDTRHVRGQPRRLKVYRLTRRGEALGRELRQSVPRSGPAPLDAALGPPREP
jgi:hypothetical protein